eukprot:3058331-Rhodomonas_salina.1
MLIQRLRHTTALAAHDAPHTADTSGTVQVTSRSAKVTPRRARVTPQSTGLRLLKERRAWPAHATPSYRLSHPLSNQPP